MKTENTELTDGTDVVIASCYRGNDGAFVIHLDTDELSVDRVLRVNVNDGPVYCAHVERGDHNTDYIGEYINEVNRRG